MARTKLPVERINISNVQQKFFETLQEYYPEVLSSLRFDVLPAFRGLPKAARWKATFLGPSGHPRLIKALDAWVGQFNLTPCLPWVSGVALQILFELSENPNHHKQGLWWVHPHGDYVDELLVLGPSVAVTLNLPAPKPATDRTPDGYLKRVNSEAQEILQRKLRTTWEEAVVATENGKGDDSADVERVIRPESEDDQDYRLLAEWLVTRKQPTFVSMDRTAMWRRINRAAKPLGVKFPPGRPKKKH